MLQTAVVVMTVMGCGDQGVSCDFVGEPKKVWTTTKACEDAIPATLIEMQNANYPVITASCDARIMASNAKPVEQKIVQKEKTNFEKIQEEFGTGDVTTKEKKPALYRLKNGYALVRDETSDVLAKIGEGARGGYEKLEGAVRVSFNALTQSANRAAASLRGAEESE
jgi:hypothetical protein